MCMCVVCVSSGFWIHGAIDGYSRKIIYLRVSDNKRSETVEKIFLEAMNDPALGWALRCRWDKGKVHASIHKHQPFVNLAVHITHRTRPISVSVVPVLDLC